MIEAKVSAVESFGLENLQELVKAPGPCITVLLPSYYPGAQARSTAGILKTSLQEAERQLSQRKISDSALTHLLDPLEQLTQDEEFLAGSRWGRVIYRSSDILSQLTLIGPVNQALTIGPCFNLRPILAELHLPAEFYLLKLSKKRVELFRCSHLQAEPVELPKGTPETLDDALAFKQPDHDLENRSAAGASAGAMRRIRFGTGAGRETQATYLADFYKAVDRGIRERLNGSNAPLVLAGVHEDTAIYRMINMYPNLLSRSISGGSGAPSAGEAEVVEQAYWIVRSHSAEKAAARLLELKERVSPARFSVHLDVILPAAVEGRVETIFIDESAQRAGNFLDSHHGGPQNWGEEDLLNRAVVETIRHSGIAYGLPNSGMPDGAAVAALFRY